jgi:hypothetical protein
VQAGLFVSYNSAGGSKARTELLEAFMDRYYPAGELEPVEPPADFATRADAYSGEYHLARANFTTAEKILMLFQPVQVAVGPEGRLAITMQGETDQYVEMEPGLLRQVRGEDRVIFLLDDKGRVTRAFPADIPPFTMFKAPWYATLGFTGALLIGGLILLLLTLLGWVVAYFTSRGHKKEALPSGYPRLARWVMALFVLVSLILFVGLFGIVGDIDPAYGVPDVFFGEAAGLSALTSMTYVMAGLAAGALVMTVLAWLKRTWGWFGRIHYSVLTLLALAWVWMLAYWNVLGAGF